MKRIITCIFLLLPLLVFSQDDLLSELEEGVDTSTEVKAAFKGLKVVNFESTKLGGAKELYLVVSHRFGTVKNGIDDFFGLDNAVTQIKFIYGVNDWLNLGAARSSLQKKYGVHAKYRLVRQKTEGFPFTIVGYNLITVNTALDEDLFPNIEFGDRLTYTTQALVSHKFSEDFSVLLAPTFIHENLATRSFQIQGEETMTFDEDNNQFAVGVGGRYKLTKRWSINADYGIHLNRNDNSNFKNPLSIGVDLETGGHVFQMHFTNAQAMFEEGFIIQGQGDWGDGDFFFGFNLSRVF
ncbi:DUF5777 family beta-barrel protein [Aureisphaera galaxeae]|uniref:DUF5777 family beta-barrel protein n=1 Tax=Aureisphaera galaxeae TaxID=1538023 RepID=UPI002350CD86|nr:DUF5777 family beta-barrel protein [Aureisphaera galaxeae]MDC8003648.1 DUF5777 family beta-barrel protein [Aureisphaera galaxeae]